MLACRRVAKTFHFQMPSADLVPACQAERGTIPKQIESWESMHHGDDEMMTGIQVQD